MVVRPNVRSVSTSSRPRAPEGQAPEAVRGRVSREPRRSTEDVAVYAISQPSPSGKRSRFYVAT